MDLGLFREETCSGVFFDHDHFFIEEYWLDIGQIPDYQRAQEIYREHFAGGNPA